MGQLAIAELLPLVAEHAVAHDEERSVNPAVITAIKNNPIMGFSAAENIGGSNKSIEHCGLELEALAATCASTAWVLWNHLCTFHLFAGLLGPENEALLKRIVENQEWVCFPAGASTGVRGSLDGETLRLDGKAAFGSGARYAEWAGVSFVQDAPDKPRFAMVDLRQPGVRIDPDWYSLSLRASATDTVYYEGAHTEERHVVPFHFMYRKVFREPERAMVHQRYREDWVAISDMWLALMAVGLVNAAFAEVTEGIKDRIAIVGVKVAERPTVHVNLGHAQSKLYLAREGILTACRQTDERIAQGHIPTEADYARQCGASMAALQLCEESLGLLKKVLGGNGLREGAAFERRLRDFQAMPLHINAHPDRVSELVGRQALGLPAENPF